MIDEFLPAAPVIVVLVGATIGVILEAAVRTVGAQQRAEVGVDSAGPHGALGWTVINWSAGIQTLAAIGSLSLDGPTWIAWTLLLFFGALSVLLFAERRVGGGESPFAASVSAVPSSQAEREAIAARQEHSEVYHCCCSHSAA